MSREFKARHIVMMGLGNSTGHPKLIVTAASLASGLFVNSSGGLYYSGPVSLALGYLLMGTVSYAVLVEPFIPGTADVKITLGEMVSILPLPGSFISLANRCLSPAAVQVEKLIW